MLSDAERTNLCDICTNPGRCCTGLALSLNQRAVDEGNEIATPLEAMVRMATLINYEMPGYPSGGDTTGRPGPIPEEAQHVWVGLPFMPLWRDPSGDWKFWCPLLDRAGRCSVYDRRPALCRSYEAGRDGLCVMHRPPGDGSDG